MSSLPNQFKCFRIDQEDDKIVSGLQSISMDDINPGEITLKTEYSSINYKDALAATGKGKILRIFPLIGGVDVAGEVVKSDDPRFDPGDKVIAACSGLSETNDGGYSEYARINSEAAIELPKQMDTRTAMAIGTAGFAAGLAIFKMKLNKQTPEMGPIVVTGATGGVGSIAIDMLSSSGFETTAITRKKTHDEYLKTIGTTNIVCLEEMELGERPLEKAQFGGGIDNVGGDLLSWVLRSTVPEGNVASIGLAADFKLPTNVMPFILRGVNLLGVNSTTLPNAVKQEVWDDIANNMPPQKIDQIVTKEVTLEELPDQFQAFIEGSIVGRVLVKV
ncbi:acryloyl-CoA reductase [Gammaproteobacteria bacterium]|nr:acryloyl-CoA reductase [Gammaproteobacteria bacterium]